MKVNTYKVLSDCVERGVEIGWRRAHKHTDTPGEGQLRDSIYDNVMTEISEYFTFSEIEEESTNVI
jgi:hypothetical protein